MSQTWVAEKERSNPFTLRLICWIALNISRPFARLWLYPITFYFLVTSPRVRFSSRSYLQRVPGQTGSLIEVAKHIFCFSATILDRVYFLTDQHHLFDFDVRGRALLDEILEQKTGCILLGAHLGSFEVLRSLAIAREKLPLKIMMHQDHNAMITKILDELNPDVANSVINLGSSEALFQMKESIDEGALIGILGDRVSEGVRRVSCQLLGGEVAMPAGAVTLASILQVPVLLFFGIYRGGNRYSIHIEKLADSISVPRDQRSQAVNQLVQKYTSVIETMIKQYPYNWFNFYDYWGDGDD